MSPGSIHGGKEADTPDPFIAYALERQPGSLEEALILFDEMSKGPDKSSPHIVPRKWLDTNLSWTNHRKVLLNIFDEFISRSEQSGITIEAILIGGSFVSRKDNPKDIDFLAIYRANSGFNPDELRKLISNKVAGLDWRFVPSDAGTVALLKISIFVHLLYEGRKGGEGSILMVR